MPKWYVWLGTALVLLLLWWLNHFPPDVWFKNPFKKEKGGNSP